MPPSVGLDATVRIATITWHNRRGKCTCDRSTFVEATAYGMRFPDLSRLSLRAEPSSLLKEHDALVDDTGAWGSGPVDATSHTAREELGAFLRPLDSKEGLAPAVYGAYSPPDADNEKGDYSRYKLAIPYPNTFALLGRMLGAEGFYDTGNSMVLILSHKVPHYHGVDIVGLTLKRLHEAARRGGDIDDPKHRPHIHFSDAYPAKNKSWGRYYSEVHEHMENILPSYRDMVQTRRQVEPSLHTTKNIWVFYRPNPKTEFTIDARVSRKVYLCLGRYQLIGRDNVQHNGMTRRFSILKAIRTLNQEYLQQAHNTQPAPMDDGTRKKRTRWNLAHNALRNGPPAQPAAALVVNAAIVNARAAQAAAAASGGGGDEDEDDDGGGGGGGGAGGSGDAAVAAASASAEAFETARQARVAADQAAAAAAAATDARERAEAEAAAASRAAAAAALMDIYDTSPRSHHDDDDDDDMAATAASDPIRSNAAGKKRAPSEEPLPRRNNSNSSSSSD